MTHLDSSALAKYNSLTDPNLKCYFSNERIKSHLRHAGLISRRGEIISDNEYRKRLVRRENKRHVRQMLAENIVHRAIDMERTRQAEIRRQLDLVAKVTLVNNMKESQRRRRRAHSSIQHETNHTEIHPLSLHSSWSQNRSKSPTEEQQIHSFDFIDDQHDEEQRRIPRVRSAYVSSKSKKTSSKISEPDARRSRTLTRPKSSIVNITHPTKVSHSFESKSISRPMKISTELSPKPEPCEITMIYYGPNMKIDYDQTLFEPVDEIIVMQQHSGGENLIAFKGQLKAGEQFTFTSLRHANYPFGLSFYVKGLINSRISTCCEYKHRHGVRLGGERGHFAILSVQGSKPCLKCRFEKQLKTKDFDKEKIEEKTKSITISIPPSEQQQQQIRSTPIRIPVRHSTTPNENYSEDFDRDSKAKRSDDKRSSIDSTLPKSPTTDEKILSQRSSSHTNPRGKSPDETNSTSTIVSDEKSSLKTWQITFYTTNTPTGSLQIPSKLLSKTFLKFSFLSKNREKQTEIYSIPFEDSSQCFQSGRQDSFPAKLTHIGQPEEIQLVLFIDQFNDEDQDLTKIKWHLDFIELIDPETQNHLKFPCQRWIRPFQEEIFSLSSTFSRQSSSRSSTSSRRNLSQQRPGSISSTEDKSKHSSRTSSSTSKRICSTHQIQIYSSNEPDGEFSPSTSTRIFLKLNDNDREILLIDEENRKGDFSFRPGQMKTFAVVLPNLNQRLEQISFGYFNSHITATCWKIEKIVLINKQTNEEFVYLSRRSLMRNDFNFLAETIFTLQSDDDQRSTPRNVQMTSASLSSDSSDVDLHSTKNSRPKTRRGREEILRINSNSNSNEKHSSIEDKIETKDIWRPTSSTDQRTSSRTTKSSNDENQFENWYSNKTNDEQKDDED